MTFKLEWSTASHTRIRIRSVFAIFSVNFFIPTFHIPGFLFFLFFLYSSFHSLGVASRWLRLNCLTSLQTYATPMGTWLCVRFEFVSFTVPGIREVHTQGRMSQSPIMQYSLFPPPLLLLFLFYLFLPIYLSLFVFGSQGKWDGGSGVKHPLNKEKWERNGRGRLR